MSVKRLAIYSVASGCSLLAFSCYVAIRPVVHEARLAVAVESYGGSCEYDEGSSSMSLPRFFLNSLFGGNVAKQLVYVDLSDSRIDDEGLIEISSFESATTIVGLSLHGSLITDDSCPLLSRFHSLRTLSLGETQITNQALWHLVGLENLQSLSLVGCDVDEHSVRGISSIQSLRFLDLSNTTVGDAAVGELAGCQLEVLRLDRTRVTDECGKDLATLERLRLLSANSTALTDSTLEALCALSELRTLLLEGTGVSVEGVASLAGCSNLQQVSLSAHLLEGNHGQVLEEVVTVWSVDLREQPSDSAVLDAEAFMGTSEHIPGG